MKTINLLVNLANKLDEQGLYVIADQVDQMIETSQSIKFFFDMDGVLANFDAAIAAGKVPQEKGFYLNLELLPDAGTMLDQALELTGAKPNILSSPEDDTEEIRNQVEQEKSAWLEEHFPTKIGKIFFSTTKFEFAAPNVCLIDDKPSMIKNFIEHGGLGILHTDVERTIAEMKSLISARSQAE